MAEGIRIRPRPDVERELAAKAVSPAGALFTVRDHDRPVPGAEYADECPHCKAAGGGPDRHYVKTYHLRLDAEGAVTVSTGVWDQLRRLADNPFEVANPVPDPPTQHLLVPTAAVRVQPSEIG